MQLVHRTLAVALLMLCGCAHRPELPDLFRASNFHQPFDARLEVESRAPIIVVGRVEKARPVGRPKPSVGDSRLLVQLTRITIRVEQVVKGGVQTDPLDFYYYTFSRQNRRDLGIARYLPILGERRVYFLQHLQGIYRSVGDVGDYTLPVRTGHHEREFCAGKSVGCCIAEILLVPGRGYDPESLTKHLIEAESAASVLCSRAAVLRLIEKLSQSPERALAQAADEILREARANGEF